MIFAYVGFVMVIWLALLKRDQDNAEREARQNQVRSLDKLRQLPRRPILVQPAPDSYRDDTGSWRVAQ